MRRALSRRPSPAMVVALIALFVSLGGSGYAAVKINGKSIKGRTIPGSKLRKDTLTGTEIKESTLGTVRRATDASTLGGKTASSFLATGGTATDATKLGGLSASSFVRNACDQASGAIKGIATVDASSTFSSTFTPVTGYNCSGGTVEVRRLSMGRYEVRFNGSPATRLVGTSVVTGVSADMVSVLNEAAGLFVVHVLDPVPSPGAFVDHPFTALAVGAAG